MSAEAAMDMQLWDALNGLCDGILTPEEEQAIVARLARDPEARALYLEIMDLHGEMRWTHRGELADEAVALAANKPVQRSGRAVLWSLASMFAVAAAVALFFKPGAQEPKPRPFGKPVADVEVGADLPVRELESPSVPIPAAYKKAASGIEAGTLAAVSGTLWLFAPGEDRVAAGNGVVVRSGTTIVCQHNGGGTLQLNEGSRFVMAPGTELTILEVDGRFDLFLGQGHVQASISPQPKNRALQCSTYNAKLEVLGTRFSMSASYLYVLEEPTSISHVLVQEGRVRFGNLAGESVEVAADEMATVDRELAPIVTSVADLKVERLEIARATYGTPTSWLDVTEAIRSRASEHRLVLTGLFNHLQGDPRYEEQKTLRVEYVVNGQRQSAEFDEWASFSPPRVPASTLRLPLTTTDLQK